MNNENQNEQEIQNVQIEQNIPKKKNRTLQYYKLLLYAMKMEIKVHEFLDLVRFSNQSEISLWILSLVLYFNSPPTFTNPFVWFHIIHIIRGLMGMILMLKLPKSYKLVEAMNVDDDMMEKRLFNDIVRDVAKREVLEKLQGMKGFLIAYFILTFINFVIDVIDLFYCLAYIDKDDLSVNSQVIILTSLIVAFLYLSILILIFSY
jgi:uncharacterized membrane protein YbhN (UPF0104 family)